MTAARGSLEILCGPMFSGKTDELIRRASGESRRAVVVKPALDTRHPPDRIVSHSGASIAAESVPDAASVAAAAQDVEVLFVDEVQFLDGELQDVIDSLRARRVDVVAAGLDLDFRREPFPATAALAAAADGVRLFEARCTRCGRAATVTQRLVNGRPAPLDDPVVRIGDEELYEPRCVACWEAEREERAVRRAP